MDKKEAAPGDYRTGDGNLPVLSVSGRTIPEAWENSVVKVYNEGLWYHHQGAKDQGRLQVDSTMTMEIKWPLSKLWLHKFSGAGWESLLDYQFEIFGSKNPWVDTTGKSDRWEYHYNQRWTAFPGTKGSFDQLAGVIERLAQKPHKRNIQMVTWVPELDLNVTRDPPCLQRTWFTVIPDETKPDEFVLNMNYNFRSRNVMVAAPMNMLGFATIHQYIVDEVVKRTGRKIRAGRMVDFIDSYHVRADNMPTFIAVIKKLKESEGKKETIEERCYDLDEIIEDIEAARPKIVGATIAQTSKYLSGEALEKEIARINGIADTVMDINRRVLEGKI